MDRIIQRGIGIAFLQVSKVYAHLPFKGIQHPVFILGCMKSGTTILGRTLSCHPQVTYLNEPREIWFSCYPKSDIWTEDQKDISCRK